MSTELKNIEDAWLNLDGFDERDLFNPMSVIDFSTDDDAHYKLIWLMSRPEYFSFLCKQVFNINILPSQALFLCEMWNRRFPMLIASRGFGKSFILSLYAMMRALLMPERKVVVVGAAFRQSKVLFEYMETIWNNSPVLRSMCDSNSGPRRDVDRCVMRINKSRITCLPLGDGQKIRGQRANDIISDEFASIPREIFETVVAGFASVSSDPIANVKKIASQKKAKELGLEMNEYGDYTFRKEENQIILSGTAYYDFNHFAEYWKKWRAIIKSQGIESRLREIFGEAPPKDFDWRDYSIIRVPYELLPEGFMDASQVARSKATVHAGIYQMEFGACFTRDSQGFFKRSLVESCVSVDPTNDATSDRIIRDNEGNPICFSAVLRGESKKQYVYGVDPASEVDNFSIVVLELENGYRKIVHCWTTTREQHKERVKRGYSTETDFYSFCARKIRDLMKIFPCVHIAMDAQGGGIAVSEALHDKDKIQEGEIPIWEVIDEDKPKDTDDHRGLHILEMCQFARYEWLSEANHGLRKDFEDKALLFPMFDSISLGIANAEDGLKGRVYDTLEQCVMEIEDLKDELAMISMTQTPSGRDKWDTPETVIGAGKKGRLRKDRYSSLIMANMAARILDRTPDAELYKFYGGFATVDKDSDQTGKLFMGPAWFTDHMKDIY
jgi:hypothetical protein